MQLLVKKLRSTGVIPHKAYDGDLAYDIYPSEDTALMPKRVTYIPTGIALRFPLGYGGVIKDRGSTPKKIGVFTVSGVVDHGFTGEIFVAMYNPTDYIITAVEGIACAQMILTPVVTAEVCEVADLDYVTDRGENMSGSSDK